MMISTMRRRSPRTCILHREREKDKKEVNREREPFNLGVGGGGSGREDPGETSGKCEKGNMRLVEGNRNKGSTKLQGGVGGGVNWGCVVAGVLGGIRFWR